MIARLCYIRREGPNFLNSQFQGREFGDQFLPPLRLVVWTPFEAKAVWEWCQHIVEFKDQREPLWLFWRWSWRLLARVTWILVLIRIRLYMLSYQVSLVVLWTYVLNQSVLDEIQFRKSFLSNPSNLKARVCNPRLDYFYNWRSGLRINTTSRDCLPSNWPMASGKSCAPAQITH